MTPIEIIQNYAGAKNDEGHQSLNSLAETTNFSLRKTLLLHTRYKDTLTQIAELHHYSKANNVGGGFLIYGGGSWCHYMQYWNCSFVLRMHSWEVF